jgi:hypothetical protein
VEEDGRLVVTGEKREGPSRRRSDDRGKDGVEQRGVLAYIDPKSVGRPPAKRLNAVVRPTAGSKKGGTARA